MYPNSNERTFSIPERYVKCRDGPLQDGRHWVMQSLAQGFKYGGEGCQTGPCCHCRLQLVHPCQPGCIFGLRLELQGAVTACTHRESMSAYKERQHVEVCTLIALQPQGSSHARSGSSKHRWIHAWTPCVT